MNYYEVSAAYLGPCARVIFQEDIWASTATLWAGEVIKSVKNNLTVLGNYEVEEDSSPQFQVGPGHLCTNATSTRGTR